VDTDAKKMECFRDGLSSELYETKPVRAKQLS
jgi:hypothetical protein